MSFVYDGYGNRVTKTVGGVTTNYLVDTNNHTGFPQVVDEIVNGAVVRTYTYGHDLISQTQLISGSWQASFYGKDGHGSVRYLTDANGNVTDTYDYDAFGTLIASTGSTPNERLFAGEQLDANLGFYYLRARYMNPNTARFMSMDSYSGSPYDPLTLRARYMNPSSGRFLTSDSFEGLRYDPVSLHKYLYANANPVDLSDPSGYSVSVAEIIGVVVSLSIRAAVFVLYNQAFHTVLLALHLAAFYGDEEYRNLYLGSTPTPFSVITNDTLYVFNMARSGVGRLLAIKQGLKPLGYLNQAQFKQSAMELRAALQSIGIEDARIGVRASSVSGQSSKGGAFRWDGADPSDIDFFIESQTLTEGLTTSNNIAGFVHPDKVVARHPALKEWSARWSDILGRKVTPGAFEPGTVPDGPTIEAPW